MSQPLLFFSAYNPHEKTWASFVLGALDLLRLDRGQDVSVVRVDHAGHPAHLGMLHQLHCRPGIRLVALYDEKDFTDRWELRRPSEPGVPDWAGVANHVIAIGAPAVIKVEDIFSTAEDILNDVASR